MKYESDRTMFEIYRESGYGRKYRVVYFTELNEHNKESQINGALSGEHVYDGFILDSNAKEAKRVIDELLQRLNDGESLTETDIEQALAIYTPA